MTERIRPTNSGERISFTPNLIGLQSRLLLGNAALDPSHNVVEHFNPNTVSSFADRSYSTFEATSTAERTGYWRASGLSNPTEQVMAWSQTMSSIISGKSFSASEQAFYGRLGIDTDQFSTEDAVEFYLHNFTNKPNQLKSFVRKVIASHTDHEALMHNMDTITWFAHIFGSQSAEIVTQLIDAEFKLINNPEAFTQDPDRINNLTEEEVEILNFAWQNHTDNERKDADDDEDEMYNVADRLLDYESGTVTNDRVDLLPYYSGFVSNVEREIANDNLVFQSEGPKIVLSDLAFAMIDRVATRANDIRQELAFSFNGINFINGDDLIATVAFIVPASDFVNTQRSRVEIDPELNILLNNQLLPNTNLEGYFVEKTGISNGNNRGVLHIHHEALGSEHNKTPSPHDYSVVEAAFNDPNRRNYIWGVVTKFQGQLGMRIFCSKRNKRGRVIHPEMKIIYESQLDQVLPQAA